MARSSDSQEATSGQILRRAALLLGWAAVVLLVIPNGTAQLPGQQDELLSFRLEIDDNLVEVNKSPGGEFPQIAEFIVTVTDTSVDQAGAQPGQGGTDHFYEPDLEWLDGGQPDGWAFDSPTPGAFSLRAGQTQEVRFALMPDRTAEQVIVQARMTVSMKDTATGSSFASTQHLDVAARLAPEPAVFVRLLGGQAPSTVSPGELVTVPFEVRNNDVYTNTIRVTARPSEGTSAEELGLSGMGVYRLAPLSSRTVNISFVAPQSDFWYNAESLFISVRAEIEGQPEINMETGYAVIVNGFNWQTPQVVTILLLLFLVVLVILFLLLARRHYQRRVLGKPIPPWEIPEERAYLDRLRAEDPRRFYVVRYFLMEEEYQSALLWFGHYKKRSKRRIKRASRAAKYEEKAASLAEFTGDKYDRRAARWMKWYAWRRKLVKRRRDRKIARLERKLDRRHEKDHKKDHKKWEKKVEKKTKKANKPILKARKKWEKERDKKLDAWEKEVADLQTDHEKETEQLRKDHEKQVKKKDKAAWKEWKAEMAEVQAENKVREKEGRDLLPLPELKSSEVDTPDYPPEPDLPPKPKLPPEPKLEEPDDLPPEPTLEKPALRDSKYAKKVNRIEAKAEKRLRKIDRKEAKRLAKVERKRAKKATKKVQKRNEYVARADQAYQPSLLERAFRLTPEDHERRARKDLVKALHEDELSHFREAEENRLDRIRANATRQEAELEAKLIRTKAQVRTAAARAGKEAAPAQEQDVEALQEKLEELKRKNKVELRAAREESERRIEEESERIQREIEQREGLADKESSKGTPSGKSGKA